jgi:hypothetical protein
MALHHPNRTTSLPEIGREVLVLSHGIVIDDIVVVVVLVQLW